MNQEQLVSTLKKEASDNPVAKAVFKVWSTRERARTQVTVHTLSQTMRAEGYDYDADEYRKLLTKLWKNGVGRIERSKSGQVIALADVKITLQSLGKAALGLNERLDRFTRQKQYAQLTQMAKDIKHAVEFPVSLTVVINGKPVNFRVPRDLSPEEIAHLVKRFQGNA